MGVGSGVWDGTWCGDWAISRVRDCDHGARAERRDNEQPQVVPANLGAKIAGPMLRAGLMPQPVTGTPMRWQIVTAPPIANGPRSVAELRRGSMVAKTLKRRSMVVISSTMKAAPMFFSPVFDETRMVLYPPRMSSSNTMSKSPDAKIEPRICAAT